MRSECFWSVVTKHPRVQGSEKLGVKCSEVHLSDVKWSEVMGIEVIILGEMCVLSLIYSYVTVCGSVQYAVSLSFASLCYFLLLDLCFLILFYASFCFVFFLFCVFCVSVMFYIVLFIVSHIVLSLSCFYICLRTTSTGRKPNCS